MWGLGSLLPLQAGCCCHWKDGKRNTLTAVGSTLYNRERLETDTGQGGLGGGKDITFAGPEIFLHQVATGASAQKGALCVFAEEGTWLWVMAALVHI